MTGISEILLLVLLIACILILPRMFKNEPVKKSSASLPLKRLSARVRLGIVLSVIYPILAAIYFKPWDRALLPYLSFGILPVFLIWAFAWVLAGKKK